MKKIILLTATLLATMGGAYAQNAAVYKAQAAEQKGDLAEAIRILDEAVANPKTTKQPEMYHMMAEDHAKLFNNELDKAARGLPFDTVAFTNHLDKMVESYTQSHIADTTPDAKGRVNGKYVTANHMRMILMLDYYNYAAMFKFQQHDTVAAVNYFEKYLALPANPIFSAAETDSIYQEKKAAYSQTRVNLATLNFTTKNWDKAITYADEALKDTIATHDLYVIKMQSYAAKNDSTQWLNTLISAVQNTEDEGFMQNLLYYYMTHNDVDGAEKMAGELIATAPENKSSWYMKGCVELNLKKNYPAARESFEKALAIDPDFVDANINMAYSYINQAVADKLSGKFKFVGTDKRILPAQEAAYKKELATVQGYYQNAQPYMEKARALTPEKPRLWAYTLQMIYENLKLKDKKAEIDAIIKDL
jgi:tetratricopeptide (TPR) repeat protein